MLVGIAVNNSIILVDRINQLKQSGMELTDAIVESGQQRVYSPDPNDDAHDDPSSPADDVRLRRRCFTSFTYGDRSDRWVGDFDRHESDGNPVCILCI